MRDTAHIAQGLQRSHPQSRELGRKDYVCLALIELSGSWHQNERSDALASYDLSATVFADGRTHCSLCGIVSRQLSGMLTPGRGHAGQSAVWGGIKEVDPYAPACFRTWR